MTPHTAGRADTPHGGADSTAGSDTRPPGLVAGARVITLKGEKPVEHVQAGDLLLARSGAVPVIRIEVVSLIAPMIYIIAGSLSHSRSDRDALLIADQTIYLHDWRATAFCGAPAALVEARKLVDGEFVRDLGQHVVTLHRIFCASPQVIYADGLELGTADQTGDAWTESGT